MTLKETKTGTLTIMTTMEISTSSETPSKAAVPTEETEMGSKQ
jgi:hypothetical protein